MHLPSPSVLTAALREKPIIYLMYKGGNRLREVNTPDCHHRAEKAAKPEPNLTPLDPEQIGKQVS